MLKFNKKYINQFMIILIAVFAIFLVAKPLLQPGFFPFHDSQQIARLYQLDKALKDGQFPVRWVKDLGFGYGYPLFNFYPPFLYYLAECFHLLGITYLWSIKLTFILSFLTALLFMYIWAKDFFNKQGAMLAGLFYLYLPYRAVDAYVRGALAELLALSWLPGLLWAGGRIFYLKKIKFKDLFYVALFLFLLMTTHNLTMLIFAPFFILWSLFFYFKTEPIQRLQRLRLFLLSIIIGAGLSAFFWLPALIEKKYTLVNQILLQKLYDYRLHFVYPDQLWHSPFGYGGSLPGREFDDINGMSFQLGKIHLTVGFVAVLISVVGFLKKKKCKKYLIVIWAFVLFTASIFMTLNVSKLIWDLFTFIQYIQFPWRFLGLAGLFIAFAAGSIKIKNKKINIAVFIALTFLIILSNKAYFKPAKLEKNLKDQDYISDEQVKWHVSHSSFEYMPAYVVLREAGGGLQLEPLIDKNSLPKERIEVIKGNGEVQIITDKTHMIELMTKSSNLLKLRANILSFPGWKLDVDDKNYTYTNNNDLKLIEFELPAGEHQVILKFTNTPVRNTANFVSLFFILLSALFLVKDKKI